MKRLCLSLLLLSNLASTLVFAMGGEVGNGTDNTNPTDGSAWFTGSNQIVHYCYTVMPNFGVSNSQIEQTLAQAFETWANYITAKGVNTGPETTASPNLQIASQSALIPKCNGQQDIQFYFGTMDSTVASFSSKYENPTAFAEKTSYDAVKGWGKGIVWLAPPNSLPQVNVNFPDWTEENSLLGILLHEIGHIYGCSHLDSTIMDADLSFLLANKLIPSAYLSQIDIYRELLLSPVSSQITGNLMGANDTQKAQTFAMFMGRAPSGNVSMNLQINKNQATLGFTDSAGSGTIQFPISVKQVSTGGIELFRVVLAIRASDGTPGVLIRPLYSAGYDGAGAFIVGGKPIAISLNWNSLVPEINWFSEPAPMSTVQMSYSDGAQQVDFFSGIVKSGSQIQNKSHPFKILHRKNY